MTNNSLSEDIYAVGELMAENLNTKGVVSADADDGLTTLAGKILEISGSSTTLTIEVPLNLVYSDDFNITGTLTDGNDDAISGATIKLKVGNTVVDTDTTDNNGEVSFTQSPVSMGNHSFQLVFEGDSTHPSAISSVVTREIGKETSAITMSAPAASSSYYSDASISVSGTLKTDDNEAISGASILVKLGATTLTTLTTGNDGSFSGSVSAGDLSTGSNTLKFEFAGDSYYSTTYQEVAVTVNAATLVLSADKSILSYADSDSCTLTATYTGATVTGKTIKLYDASDDSEISTMTDNNDGTYTSTYVSEGVGDIGFYAKCGSLVTETYGVQDCRFFDVSSSENVSKYGSSSAFSYDSTEQAYYITTSSAKNITRDSVVGDFDFEISMDFKLANGNTNFYCGESTTGYECQGQITGSSIAIKGVRTYYTDSSRSISGRQYHGSYTLTNSKWYTYKVTRVGNTLTAQILDGDTVIATATDSDVRGTSNNVSWHNYVATGQMYWKNIKFKPL